MCPVHRGVLARVGSVCPDEIDIIVFPDGLCHKGCRHLLFLLLEPVGSLVEIAAFTVYRLHEDERNVRFCGLDLLDERE